MVSAERMWSETAGCALQLPAHTSGERALYVPGPAPTRQLTWTIFQVALGRLIEAKS